MTGWNNPDLPGVPAIYGQTPDVVSIAGEEPEVHGVATLRRAPATNCARPEIALAVFSPVRPRAAAVAAILALAAVPSQRARPHPGRR